MSNKSTLDRIQIPKPCFADWERMVGSQNIRFCTECNKHVYNLSGMTRREAEALVASAPKGQLCARLTRGADGTTLTVDDQPGVQFIWRRASPIANAVVSAMLTMATPGIASAAGMTRQQASIASAVDGQAARPETSGAPGFLSGKLFDPQEAVIVGATLELLNEETGEVQTTTSSGDGSFRFVAPSNALFTLKAAANGFTSVSTSGLRVGQQIDIKLAPSVVTMGGAIGVPVRSLRELYNDSDRIVVARVARSVSLSVSVHGSHIVRTSLNVSSTLKGDGSLTVVNVYHYGDKNLTDQPSSGGEDLLVFLKQGGTTSALASANGYELADYSRAIKKLSTTDLSAYLQRIRELDQLLSEEEPAREELVEWLVRCAEDPATRWEGAVDLASSVADLRRSCSQDNPDEDSEGEVQDVSKGEATDTEKSDKATEDDTDSAIEAEELGNGAELAALLTADQKERLMKALLSSSLITEGDMRLIDVVKDFHDSRLLPFLVSQLRRVENDPPETASEIVQVIAELLNDRLINALSERYGELPSDDEEDAESAETMSAAARARSAVLRDFLKLVDRKIRK